MADFRDKALDYSIDIVQAIGDDWRADQLSDRVALKAKKVQLAVSDLHKKIKTEKKRILTKMISGYGGFISLSSLIASFVTSNWWLTVLGFAAQTLLTIHDQQKLIEKMRRESGLAYLLELEKYKDS